MAAGTAQLLVGTYLTGGIVSPVVYGFPVLVVFISTLVEFRVVLWVASMLLVGAVLIWLPDYADYRQFTHHAPLHIRTLTLAWCMATATGVGWLYTTETRRTEANLLAAIEAREKFVAYLSHELRNPLTAILGAADLLSADDQDSRQAGLVGALQRSARGMTQVLEDVLDVSKADAGMLQLNLAPTSVSPLAEGLVSELSPLAETRGVELRLDAEGISNQRVFAAEHRLQQVLRNLLSNSLKFTAAGGLVTLRVSSKESSSVLFEVTDTGVGISAEDLRTILEPFRQAKRARAGGTGLGLPISSRLRRAMNSELRVHSQLGQGSCFSFSLPCAAPSLPSEEAAQSSGATPGSPVVKAAPRPLELLLVDDNDEAREVISGLLEQLSCEIKTARDGLEALELVTIRRPEVVLLDIQMPRLGGVETAKELRRRFPAGEFPSLKLIAVTGNSDAQGELSQSGLFDQVIAKPVGLAQLEAGLLEVTCRQARAD